MNDTSELWPLRYSPAHCTVTLLSARAMSVTGEKDSVLPILTVTRSSTVNGATVVTKVHRGLAFTHTTLDRVRHPVFRMSYGGYFMLLPLQQKLKKEKTRDPQGTNLGETLMFFASTIVQGPRPWRYIDNDK